MSSHLDNLRSEFAHMSLASKKQFISRLKHQVEGSNIPAYTEFLNECIQKYDAEYNSYVAGIGVGHPENERSTSGEDANGNRRLESDMRKKGEKKKQRKPLLGKAALIGVAAAALIIAGVLSAHYIPRWADPGMRAVQNAAVKAGAGLTMLKDKFTSSRSPGKTAATRPIGDYALYFPAEYGIADYGEMAGAKENDSLSDQENHLYGYDDVDAEKLMEYDALLKNACGFEGGLAADIAAATAVNALDDEAGISYSKEYGDKKIHLIIKRDRTFGFAISLSFSEKS